MGLNQTQNKFLFDGNYYDNKFAKYYSICKDADASDRQVNYVHLLIAQIKTHKNLEFFKVHTAWIENAELDLIEEMVKMHRETPLKFDKKEISKLIKNFSRLLDNMSNTKMMDILKN